MKRKLIYLITAVAAAGFIPAVAAELVILTTNDTHSNIDTDANGLGGILQRKAIIDSVRSAEKNVILVDAGDMVQGSLYFKYFRGDVEYPLFNMMDYDIRILGNHEFDNGLEELAEHWKNVKASRLSANYDFKGTAAEGIFEPYTIKKVGGKKIGFIGVNVNPESLIDVKNYEGMKFLPIIETANRTAEYLKDKKKCDLVVAVTHIGYDNPNGSVNDRDLAASSKDIDIIIGGHSHSFVDPSTPAKTPYWTDNSVGRPVLVTQTGKYGRNVGYIKIDLDKIGEGSPEEEMIYRYIPVTDRFSEEKFDKRMVDFIRPFKHSVDSVNSLVIARSMYDMSNVRTGGMANFAADMAMDVSRLLADTLNTAGDIFPVVDMSIMNVGGIRQPMASGDITEGQILNTFPFSNKMLVIRLKGRNIIDALGVAARKGGEAISDNVRVLTDNDGTLQRVIINGKEMNPEQEYNVMTIDYVAAGNDDLTPLAEHTVLWNDDMEMSQRVLAYLRHLSSLGLSVAPDQTSRFQPSVVIP